MTERDEVLAARAQQGNMTAFAALVDRHKGHIYRTLFQVVGDEQDAQDLAQEVFLKVYRSLSGFRGEAAFATWLHRLTLNTAFDWLRARRRRPLPDDFTDQVLHRIEAERSRGLNLLWPWLQQRRWTWSQYAGLAYALSLTLLLVTAGGALLQWEQHTGQLTTWSIQSQAIWLDLQTRFDLTSAWLSQLWHSGVTLLH